MTRVALLTQIGDFQFINITANVTDQINFVKLKVGHATPYVNVKSRASNASQGLPYYVIEASFLYNKKELPRLQTKNLILREKLKEKRLETKF